VSVALTQDVKIEGVMSEISNITPAAVPALKSQLLNAAGESSQTAVPVAHLAAASLPTASVNTLEKGNEQRQLSAENVKAAAVVGNRVLQAANNNLQFQVDEATNQVVVKIVDERGEVIRQIPTVDMLSFIRAMKEQEKNIGKLYRGEA